MTRGGLLDLVALGNLCVFGSALDPCLDTVDDTTDDIKPSYAIAAAAYISIIQRLRKDYCLVFLSEDMQADSPDSLISRIHLKEGVNCRALSFDIGDFARNSGAHFGRSLIYYAQRAIKARKDLGEHESTLFNLESFEKNVVDAMDSFLQTDLTKDFLNAYRAQKIKCLHVRPLFLVRRKTDILQIEPDVYSDWQALTDYDCHDSEDGQNGDGNSGGDDGAADMVADASTKSSNMDVDDGDTADNRVPPLEEMKVFDIRSSINEKSWSGVSGSNDTDRLVDHLLHVPGNLVGSKYKYHYNIWGYEKGQIGSWVIELDEWLMLQLLQDKLVWFLTILGPGATVELAKQSLRAFRWKRITILESMQVRLSSHNVTFQQPLLFFILPHSLTLEYRLPNAEKDADLICGLTRGEGTQNMIKKLNNGLKRLWVQLRSRWGSKKPKKVTAIMSAGETINASVSMSMALGILDNQILYSAEEIDDGVRDPYSLPNDGEILVVTAKTVEALDVSSDMDDDKDESYVHENIIRDGFVALRDKRLNSMRSVKFTVEIRIIYVRRGGIPGAFAVMTCYGIMVGEAREREWESSKSGLSTMLMVNDLLGSSSAEEGPSAKDWQDLREVWTSATAACFYPCLATKRLKTCVGGTVGIVWFTDDSWNVGMHTHRQLLLGLSKVGEYGSRAED
ncbi:hypothetical protein ARMSODRAFT_982719 [Armillaria solidipes]|uniref:Uncharacterized protein n=1 Tax=Armillaria solidipes TaxID=1076256 RepID=A0A2H3AYE1_9AGAR|nr:hypothetical protein ARMSODRAFT_982719 [Armillaria solidipes]